MSCAHDGFHTIDSWYDRRDGVLVFFWRCERCDARLREVGRHRYRPRYDPHAYERYRLLAGLRQTARSSIQAN